jgi:hypothetical protein
MRLVVDTFIDAPAIGSSATPAQDVPFLEVAVAGHADVIVTGNKRDFPESCWLCFGTRSVVVGGKIHCGRAQFRRPSSDVTVEGLIMKIHFGAGGLALALSLSLSLS